VTGIIQGDGAGGISAATTDGSGDCAPGAVCLGDHGHSAYTTPDGEFAGYSETCITVGSDTTPEYDLSVSNCYIDTIDTGETTATFSNPPVSGKLGSLLIVLTNGGSQTLNLPTSVQTDALTLQATGTDWVECATVDGGTTWGCSLIWSW